MRFFKQPQSAKAVRWTLAFLAGFFAGIAAVCLFPEELVAETGFLDAAFLSKMQMLAVNQNGLLLYSLRCRLEVTAFLVLLAAAGLAGLGSLLLLGWCGISAGCMLTALSMRYGIRGILFFLGCLLPQQLFLIPGYFMLLCWCEKRNGKRRLFYAFSMIFAGCLLESYVNPAVIKMVIKIFLI